MKPQTSQLTCKDEARNMLSNEKWNHKHDNEHATMDWNNGFGFFLI